MKKHILIIDDSKAIRFLLQTVLGKDYRVVTVPDGYSAIYYLSHRDNPDLIIVDPQLPDMENWELIQQLSMSGMYGTIPMIVLSALEGRETEAKCLEYGVSRYFSKPFNPIELLEVVGMMVRQEAMDKGLTSLAS